LNQLQSLERQERFLRILQKDRGGGREDGPRQAPALAVLPDEPALTKSLRAVQRVAAESAGLFDPLLKSVQDLVDNTDLQRVGQLQLQLQGLFELGGDSPSPAVVEAMQKVGLAINALTPGQQELRATQARLAELLGNTPSGQLDGVINDIGFINAEFEKGSITAEQWADVVRATTARLPKDTEKALTELSAFTKQFQSNVQNVLGDNIASVLRGDFDSIEDAWKDMLLSMVAQATAADLASRIFGKDGRGGWLADLSKFAGGFFADGGAFSQGQQITAFADGGVLNRPTFFGMSGNRMGVAGEAGPEAVLPLKRGSDGRLGVASVGGAGGGLTVINHVAAGVTRGEVTAAIQLAMQHTEAGFMAKMRAARVL
jgi:hypothetical protein